MMLDFEVLSQSIDISKYLFQDLGARYVGKSGNSLIIECPNPLHVDKNPSCYFDPEGLMWHCFGCREKGTIIDLVEKFKDVSREEARNELIGLMGMERSSVSDSFKKRYMDVSDMQDFTLSTQYRRDWSNARSEILEFVKDRGYNLLMFDKYFIGYNNYIGSITIPIIYMKKVINIGERFVLGDHKTKIQYLKDVPLARCIFGLIYEKYDQKDPHFTEGYADALRLREAGLNAYALLSNQLTETKMRILYDHFHGEFTIWPDNDQGGLEMIRDWRKVLHFSDVKVAQIRGYKDPDETPVEKIYKFNDEKISLRELVFSMEKISRDDTCDGIEYKGIR